MRSNRFQSWVSTVRQKYRKPSPDLSVLASRRCVLIFSLPNNRSLEEVYLQAYVFGPVRDIVITPPEERQNSSRFVRVEFFGKQYSDKFMKVFEHLSLFAGCTIERFTLTPNQTLRRNPKQLAIFYGCTLKILRFAVQYSSSTARHYSSCWMLKSFCL